jgi:O-antigen/teichoic acid export membrane protein
MQHRSVTTVPKTTPSDTVAATDDQAEQTSVPEQSADMPSTRRTLVFVYVGYVFRYLYLLVLVPFYGRVLGAAEYGRLLTAMSLYQVVWLLVDYGFPAAGARDITMAADATERAVLYGRHMKARLLVALPGFVVGVACTMLSPVLAARPLLGILATVNGVVVAFNLGWYFQGILRFRTSVLLEASGFAMNLAAILTLVHAPEDSWMIMASLLASSSITTIAAHVIAWRTMDAQAIRLSGGRKLLRDSTALFAHVGLSAIMGSAPTYLFGLFGSATQVGWFGAAERVASVGLSLMQPANQVMIANVTRRLKSRDDNSQGYALMRTSMLVLSGFGLVMLLGTLVLAGPVLPLLLGPSFGPSTGLLQTIAFMFPFAAFNQVVIGYVLIPMHMESVVSRISFAGTIATVLMVFVLGYAFGESGVAWSRVVGVALMTLVSLLALSQKNLLRPIFFPRRSAA